MPVVETTPAWDAATLRDPHRQVDKARRVREMFDTIAPTYERVNRVTSAGRDRFWRRTAVRLAGVRADDRVLDLACGTGDLAREFLAAGPSAVVGVDFAERMLNEAAARPAPRLTFARGDALSLPFASDSFTITSCAFGVRNFQDLTAGLREMHRVLRPGGRAVLVEFAMPRGIALRAVYRMYFRYVLPRLAAAISGDRNGAYRYLPRSVETFVDPPGLCDACRAAGFNRAEAHPMTMGIAFVCLAWKNK